MIVTDQKISETTPNTFSFDTGTGCGSAGLNTVWMVYSGLVPISPNTTPKAPSSRAIRAVPCLITLPHTLASPTLAARMPSDEELLEHLRRHEAEGCGRPASG